MDIWLHTYIHTFMHAHIHMHAYKHKYIHTHSCISAYMQTYSYAYNLYACVHTYRPTDMCAGTNTCICAYIHQGMLTYICIYICKWTVMYAQSTHTDRQPHLSTNMHTCICEYNICITHTFHLEKYIILEFNISIFFRFSYFQYFEILRISILLEYGNLIILEI